MRALNSVMLFALGVLAGASLHLIPTPGLAQASAASANPTANPPAADLLSIERRLARVEDHIAIERLLMEYGRSLDSGDFAAFSRLFAANGEWSGSYGTFKGPAAIQTAMEKFLKPPPGAAPAPPSYHLLTNAIIDLDGDRATAISKWTFVRIIGGRPQPTFAGYYDDRLVRENGRWRFLRRAALAVRPAGAR